MTGCYASPKNNSDRGSFLVKSDNTSTLLLSAALPAPRSSLHPHPPLAPELELRQVQVGSELGPPAPIPTATKQPALFLSLPFLLLPPILSFIFVPPSSSPEAEVRRSLGKVRPLQFQGPDDSPHLWLLWGRGQPRPMGRGHPSASPWLVGPTQLRQTSPLRAHLQAGPRISHRPIYKPVLINSAIPVF